MGDTKIEWTDKSWNPVTGCEPVSEGCKNCYAKGFAKRFWGDQVVTEMKGDQCERPRRFSDVQCHHDRLDQPLHWRKPRVIFVPSMGDLFHRHVPYPFIVKVWDIMMQCPQHTFMVLTKRPERALDVMRIMIPRIFLGQKSAQNIWIGVSAENQARWDERVPILLEIPAALRFVSIEPCLSMINIKEYCNEIGLIIVGGEKGSGARPMCPMWPRNIRNQCSLRKVAFFFKQMGSGRPTPEDLEIKEWPFELQSLKVKLYRRKR